MRILAKAVALLALTIYGLWYGFWLLALTIVLLVVVFVGIIPELFELIGG